MEVRPAKNVDSTSFCKKKYEVLYLTVNGIEI